LFVVFRNILFLLFITWQLLNTIGRFELFPSAGTVVVFRFVLLDSGWSIPNEFGGLRHVRVKKLNTFSQIPRQREKKLNSLLRNTSGFQIWLFTSLRIKVKKKYSEWIWRFDAREGKKVKSSCKYPGSGKNERINPKYENTRKIHRLLTNQNPGFLYKV
jgi:hypothetical protein